MEKLQEKTDNRLKRDSNWNNIFPEKARSRELQLGKILTVEELRAMVGKASLKNTKPISHQLQIKMRGVPINLVQIEFKKGAA